MFPARMFLLLGKHGTHPLDPTLRAAVFKKFQFTLTGEEAVEQGEGEFEEVGFLELGAGGGERGSSGGRFCRGWRGLLGRRVDFEADAAGEALAEGEACGEVLSGAFDLEFHQGEELRGLVAGGVVRGCSWGAKSRGGGRCG